MAFPGSHTSPGFSPTPDLFTYHARSSPSCKHTRLPCAMGVPLFLAEAGYGRAVPRRATHRTHAPAWSLLCSGPSARPPQAGDFPLTTPVGKRCSGACRQGRHCQPTFTGEETQASRNYLICPRMCQLTAKSGLKKLGFTPDLPGSRSHAARPPAFLSHRQPSPWCPQGGSQTPPGSSPKHRSVVGRAPGS